MHQFVAGKVPEKILSSVREAVNDARTPQQKPISIVVHFPFVAQLAPAFFGTLICGFFQENPVPEFRPVVALWLWPQCLLLLIGVPLQR